jgi:hypothetical protein
MNQNCQQIDFVSASAGLIIRRQQIVQLFCNRGSLEGAIIALKRYGN